MQKVLKNVITALPKTIRKGNSLEVLTKNFLSGEKKNIVSKARGRNNGLGKHYAGVS